MLPFFCSFGYREQIFLVEHIFIFLFMCFNISGLLSSPALSLAYMRQKENAKKSLLLLEFQDLWPLCFLCTFRVFLGYPGSTSGKEPSCQCRRHERPRFNPWVRKIPWGKGFLPGESHGQRSLVGYSPWCHKELDMTEHAHTCIFVL